MNKGNRPAAEAVFAIPAQAQAWLKNPAAIDAPFDTPDFESSCKKITIAASSKPEPHSKPAVRQDFEHGLPSCTKTGN